LRHWPPGTNSKTFVPPFFALMTPAATIKSACLASWFPSLQFKV
jgi:hypothetical protein